MVCGCNDSKTCTNRKNSCGFVGGCCGPKPFDTAGNSFGHLFATCTSSKAGGGRTNIRNVFCFGNGCVSPAYSGLASGRGRTLCGIGESGACKLMVGGSFTPRGGLLSSGTFGVTRHASLRSTGGTCGSILRCTNTSCHHSVVSGHVMRRAHGNGCACRNSRNDAGNVVSRPSSMKK